MKENGGFEDGHVAMPEGSGVDTALLTKFMEDNIE